MSGVSITQFPNLHAYTVSNSKRDERIATCIPDFDLSESLIYIAWAELLKGYTGLEQITFLSDDRFIHVDTSSREAQKESYIPNTKDEAPNSGSNATGVYFRKDSPQGLALTLSINVQERTASLSANGRVPSDHLEEIAKQLIELATSTEQGPLEKPSAETPPSKAKLSVVNPFPLLLPGPRLLHDLVRTQDGENNAIECLGPSDERTAMSYADLHTRSRSVAREIQLVLGQTESSTRQIVPLLLPQSPELYVAQLAILQAGCAFCPLNLDAPEERIRFIFRDVSAEVVITTSALRDRIPRDDRVRTITIDEVKSVSTFKKFPAPNTIRPDDTAYVMYTSGSTGQPKGVEVSHMAATQSLLAHEQHVPKFSRFLQFAAPTFDVSVFEIFFPFFRGCTLVCCDRTSLLNDLPSVINDMRVDAAELTPTVASGLLQGRSRVPGLRLLLTIGEMLTSRVIEEFGSSPSSPGILFGMYGPTEAAIHCTLEPTFNGALKAGIIGRPLETTSAIIVKPLSDDTRGDENLEILPVGHVGELAVGGYQLATGYLNRPEQTLGVFNGSAQFGRIYRTGDKARMLPDGRLECLGRIATGQVKLRGQRIELGEIEQVVLRLPQCDLSTASVIDGNLVVFCVKGDELLSQAAVREICRNWLPGFMVPSDIVILEFFPQLPSGKVDKRKLEEEYRKAQRNIAQESEDVSDATQDSIRQVFEEVLKRKVSVSTDLSAAGLDSLLAIKAASQLREEGWQVRAVDLLKTRNVSQLTSSLQDDLLESKDKVTSSQTSNNNASANLEQKVRSIPEVIDRGIAINDIHECTPLQLSMLAETAIDERAYFNWIEFEFPQSTSVERMKMCVRHLVRLNSVLRSGFCPIDSSQSPYALLVWAELHEEQVREVDSFNGSKSDLSLHLLHPVRIDLTITDGKSRALVVIHHALYDGWSIDLIVRDLSALVRGDEPVSRPQFRSVAKYYSGLEATAHAQTAKQYWEERMMDYQVNQLPNFHGRNVESETLQCYSTSLTSKLDALRSGAQSLQVGAQVFCQAALAYLLSCYHNAGDVTFGTVTSGRTLPVAGIENVVGPCLATLPLRLDLSQCKSSGDLLRVVHSGNRDLLDHDAVTLKDIKRICGIKPGAQLFDTLFVWQETLHSGQEGDIAVHVVNSWDRLEFNLTLEFEPRNNDILVRVRYRNSTMPEAQARLIVQQLDGFISVLLSAGDTDLTSLSQGLNDSVLSIENPKSTHNQFEDGLASRVEYWARHHPDQPALTFYTTMSLETVDEEQLTYSELNARANRLAHHIRALGVQPNDLVCVCIEKSAQFYVAVLAIVKTGAGYLPITPQTPRQRIKTMLQDSQPRLCLSTSTSSEGLPTITASRVLELDHIGLDEDCEDNLCMPYHGGDAAYAVFTSGSTGTPKGLLVTQDNLLSNLKELSNIYPTSPSSRLLQSCSQAFDVSVFEIFFAWQQGMCLCSATNDVLFRNIEVSITQMGITHLSLTPTVASLIDPAQVPCVKFLVTAGEGVTEKVFSRWADRGLHQGYGPAETVNICTVRPRVASSDAINNVGWVLRNTSAFVVDPSTTDLKLRGAIGELCFGGDQVCRGYLNRVELTSEKFIDHPEFGRLYRSGDLGRLLADGCILFEGRADDQIKIRGQRVELGEINRCILMQPFVRDCVTILAKLNRGRSPRLISFWVPQETTSKSFMPILDDLTASERVPTLYEHAISQLAHYMIPSNLIPVSLLPQTAQGKIDKRLLLSTFESMPPGHLEMTSQRSELEENSPWSRLERRIATQVAEVLRLSDSDIRRTSSFFNLGLDSISAISLARSLEASVGGTVFVTDILRNPTTARLARVLKDKKGAMVVEKDDSLPFYDVKDAENMINTLKGDKDNIEKFLPCTPLQTAMLSAALSTSEGAYCNRLVFKLNKDSSSLRECFTHVLQRHQIFRIAFINQASVSDPCVQAVLSNHTPEWTEASVADDQQWNSALDRLHEKVRYSLEGYLPPHAMALLQRGNDTFLVFFCHHALYDGSAFATVIGEVESLFRGESLAPQPEVEPFLREVTKQQSQATDKFWMTAFEDFQPMRFPSFQSACASEPAPRHECTTTVLEVPLQELESACQKLSCTTLAVLQAAWAKLLTLYLGAEDVCFGTVVSGRHLSIPDIDRLVAPCFNTIPVRADISGIRTNNDLMKHLQQLNAEALPHSLTSLRRIQSVLQLDGQPLFDTLIILQRSDYTLDESIWTLEEDVGDMDFRFILELVPNHLRDTLRINFHYDASSLYSDDTHLLLSVFQSTVLSCIQYPASEALSVPQVSHSLLSRSNLDYRIAGISWTSSPRMSEMLPPLDVVLSNPRRFGREGDIWSPPEQWMSGDHFAVVSPRDNAIVPCMSVGELIVQEGGITSSQTEKSGHTGDQLRTGFLARMDCNGAIQSQGFTYTQEGRINQRLENLPVVRDAALVLLPASTADPEDLVAFVTLKSGSNPEQHEQVKTDVCEALQTTFSILLQPDQVCVIDRIPYTKVGRLNKRRFRSLYNSSYADTPSSYSVEWSPTASSIRAAFQKVSGAPVKDIRPHTTIFRLGLDSISAVQVAMSLRETWSSITLADIMQHPTCNSLAKAIDQRALRSRQNGVSAPKVDFPSFEDRYKIQLCTSLKIPESSVAEILPCTPMQDGILSEFLQSSKGLYCNKITLKLLSKYSVADIRAAMSSVTKVHLMLRTGFAQTDDHQHPFTMLCYAASFAAADNLQSNLTEPQDWGRSIVGEIRNGLQRPPWRMLIYEREDQRYIDLVILHALYDAHSLQLILNDFSRALRGQSMSAESDIKIVLKEILQASHCHSKEQRSFWTSQAESLRIAHFPNMNPLQEYEQSFVTLSRQVSRSRAELEDACKEAEFTIQAAAQASWARLLSAYLGEDQVTFGVVFSGRSSVQAESACFPCVTTLPYSSPVSPRNRDILQSAMNYNSAVRMFQFVPLSRIQRWSGHSREALFDTILAYQRNTVKSVDWPWLLAEEYSPTDYAVSIELEITESNSFSFKITFDTSRIPRQQAETLLRQLDLVFVDLVMCPDGSSDQIYDCSQDLFSVIPALRPELDSHIKLLHEFVEEKARDIPDTCALEFVDGFDGDRPRSRCWTYKNLNHEGDRVRSLLQELGVRPGQLVAICFDKCPEASFAILGTLKAGSAYVAIDHHAPAARKRFILDDSNAVVILSFGQLAQSLRLVSHVPIVDLSGDTISRDVSLGELCVPTRPDDTCYLLYTSGTTGTPKGCEITHENAVQAMISFQHLFRGLWDKHSRWLQFASFHFDVSVLEQYWSWSVGIRVVSASRDLIFEDLAFSIRRLRITHIDLTPSLAKLLTPDDVPDLCKGVFITGGEKLQQEILDVWGPKGVIYNGYGPTEATIGVTMYPRVPANGKPSNIGPQFLNVGTYVLQPESDLPVFRGAVGELCVSGKLVGKGYLKRPDLTAERFPFLNKHQERVYRTGDLVRVLYDECFDFLGRVDDQVKLRGQRLEIGEINSIIRQAIPSLKDIATLVLKHPKQQREQLVTFLVTSASKKSPQNPEIVLGQQGSHMAAEALTACSEKLPPYMVPTHAIHLTSIPLSANNKIDGQRLKQIYSDIASEDLLRLSGGANDKPLSERERRIISILGTFASVDEDAVRKSSSIFELGLDSISVFGFAQALKSRGFASATVSIIMNNPTISRLTSVLESGPASSDRAAIISAKQSVTVFTHKYKAAACQILGVSATAIESIAPCTPLQQGMIARSIKSDYPLYFAAFNFELSATVNINALCGAWEKAVEALETLRTRFIPTSEGFVQVVQREGGKIWNEFDVAREHNLMEWLSARHRLWWKQNKENLQEPVEIMIARSPNQTVLALHMFHGLYDANSLQILLGLVAAVYKQSHDVDYGPPFHQALAHGPLKYNSGAKKFWIDHLQDAKGHRMPNALSVSSQRTSSALLRMEVGQRFEELRRELGVTDQALVQACWLAVLQHKYHGILTVGVVVSGRSIDFKGADKVVGPMFNTIPFHIKFEPSDTWIDVVKRCHAFNVAALTYQHTPLRDIHKWLKVQRGSSLFDTLFVFQKEVEAKDSIGLWKQLKSEPIADYPLAIDVEYCRDGSLEANVTAQSQYFTQEDLDQGTSVLASALSAMLEKPNSMISGVVGKIEARPTANGHTGQNGVMPNGYHSNGTADLDPVQLAVRDEVANLAGIDAQIIDLHQSILELGLDSIDAVKLSSRLAKLGYKIPVSSIMREMTIEKIAGHLVGKGKSLVSVAPRRDVRVIEQQLVHYLQRSNVSVDNFERVLPTSPIQDAMVAAMLGADFSNYFNMDIMKLAPGVNARRLGEAWNTVYHANAILRTTFVPVEDPNYRSAFAQCILRPTQLPLNETRCDEFEELSEIQDQIRTAAAERSGADGLFSVMLVRCQGDTYLLLSIAHALYDGWSLSLMHSDVHEAYFQRDVERPSYTETLGEILSVAESQEAEDFWNDSLSGAQPSLFSSMSDDARGSGVHRLENPSQLSMSDLRMFCKTQGVTLQALALTCWSLVLAWYSRKLEVISGMVLSGRDTEEASEVLFPTMTTVAFRTFVHSTFAGMLQYVQETITLSRVHQHFPLAKAVKCADTGGNPLFDTLFIYQTRPESAGNVEKPLYESIRGASDVEFSVCVEAETVGNELIWRTACKGYVLDVDGAHELLGRLDHVLRTICNAADSPVLEDLGNGLSIAGLPSFEIEIDDETSPQEQHPENSECDLESSRWSVEEQAIREVLATASNIEEEEIYKQSTLYHLGLDSISAIKVSRQLRIKGVKLSVSELLRAGSVTKMAQVASSKEQDNAKQNASASPHLELELPDDGLHDLLRSADIAQDNVEKALPATAGQVYMLSAWQRSEGTVFYSTFKYRVSKQLSIDTLRSAWERLVRLNPMLRTLFLATGRTDTPIIQVILTLAMPTFHITNSDWETQEALTTYNKQPLVCLVVQDQGEDWCLELRIHHALYDGVSLPLLISQMQDLCNGKHITPPSLGPYEQYVLQARSSEARNASHAFWTSYLYGATSSGLPRPRSLNKRVDLFVLDGLPDFQRPERLARKEGVSVQSFFLAAYAQIYARLAHREASREGEDVIIGIYLANRSHEIDGLPNLPVPTVNLVPLRVAVTMNRDLVEVATQVQRDLQELSTIERSGVGLWEIEKWTGIKIDSFVNFLKLPDADSEGTDELESRTETEGYVRIEEVKSRSSMSYGQTVDVSLREYQELHEVKNNVIKDAYLYSLDIEAAVVNGALGVGVFCAEDMVHLEQAQRIVHDLGSILEEFCRRMDD